MTPDITNYVPPATLSDLVSKRQEGLSAAQVLTNYPCDTPEHEKFFSDGLTMVRDLLRSLDARRTSITKPLLDAKRAIDDLFRPATEPWEQVEKVIRAKLAASAQRRLDAEITAKKEALRLAAQGETTKVVEALATIPERVVLQGASASAEWYAEVVDESLIPRDWLCIDTSKLKIFCKDHKNSEHIPPVPGLKFVRRATVRAK